MTMYNGILNNLLSNGNGELIASRRKSKGLYIYTSANAAVSSSRGNVLVNAERLFERRKIEETAILKRLSLSPLNICPCHSLAHTTRGTACLAYALWVPASDFRG